ncbi:hypothetical protein RI367_003340 [Sorochytrium milnesiophthora]
MVAVVRAVYTYQADGAANLSFQKGDIIQVFVQMESGWWDGLCRGQRGWFPSNYVEAVVLRSHAEERAWQKRRAAAPNVSNDRAQSWYWYNDLTGESLWDDERQAELSNNKVIVLPLPWAIHITEDGTNEYFINEETGEISWTLPADIWSALSTSTSANTPATPASASSSENNNSDASAAQNGKPGSLAERRSSLATSVRRPSLVSGISSAAEGSGGPSTTAVGRVMSPRPSSTRPGSALANNSSTDPDALPPNWGRKATPQGRTYFYNMMTDETTYNLSDIDPVTGRLRSQSSPVFDQQQQQQQPLPENSPRRPSSSSNSLPPAGQTSPANGDDAAARAEQDVAAAAPQSQEDQLQQQQQQQARAWSALTAEIFQTINVLHRSAKAGAKENYMPNSQAIVAAIRRMFAASGASSKDSPVVRSNPAVGQQHRVLLKALTQFVLQVRAASGSWPPPDAVPVMMATVSELLTAVRAFIDAARSINLSIDLAIVDAPANGQLQQLQQQQPPRSTTPAGNPSAPSSAQQSRSGTPLPPATTQQPAVSPNRRLSSLGRMNTEDVGFLDNLGRQILASLETLRNSVVQQQQQPRGASASALSHSIIQNTRHSVAEVGRFLTYVEEKKLGTDPMHPGEGDSPLLRDLRVTKNAMYDAMTSVVQNIHLLAAETDEAQGYRNVLESIENTQRHVRNVLMTIKLLADASNNSRASLIFAHRQSISDVGMNGSVSPQNPRSPTTPSGATYSYIAPQQRQSYYAPPVPENNSLARQDQLPPTPNEPLPTAYVAPYNGFSGRREGPGQGNGAGNGGNLMQLNTELANMHLNNNTSSSDGNGVSSFIAPSSKQPVSPVTPFSSAKLKKFFGGDVDSAITSHGSPSFDDAASVHSRQSKGAPNLSPHTPHSSQFSDKPGTVSGPVIGRRDERPWYLRNDYQPYELLFNMEGQIKGGTLEALVERLTLHDEYDSNFMTNFLFSYRTFTTSVDLFTLLTCRFTIHPPEGMTDDEMSDWIEHKMTPIRLRVFNVMKNWLENFCLPVFADDAVVLDRMATFARHTMRPVMATPSVQLAKLIDKRKESTSVTLPLRQLMQAITPTTPTNQSPPAPIVPRSLNKVKFIDLDPLEIARQLTLIEFNMYSQIVYTEFIDKAWTPQDKSPAAALEADQRAPNIRGMIAVSNKITTWVCESILSDEDPKKRCSLVKHYIYIADKCRQLNNFNTMFSIMAALNSAAITRLKRTWEMLSSKTMAVFAGVDRLTTMDKNYAEYRELLHSVGAPCLPFLGRYLTDLTFTEDGNANFLTTTVRNEMGEEPRLINFTWRAKLAEILREIQRFQVTPYNLQPVPAIQQRLLAMLDRHIPDEELWEMSNNVEPREREDQKLVRLLLEGGLLG